jgi:hypothetical protein
MKSTTPELATSPTSQKHQRLLLVARESSDSSEAKYLLGQLFTNIVRGLRDFPVELPDFKNVVELYEDPHKVGAQVFRAKGMKAVLITGKQCDVLVSLGSARKLNDAGDNAFVETLIEVLAGGGYHYMASAAISRFCRNTKLAGKLEAVLDAERTTVLAAGQEIRVWEPHGQLLWMLLVWFATTEAQQIEARLIAGKMARAERGIWTFGFPPPPGWKRTKDQRVVVYPEAAEAVRFLIREVLSGRDNLRQVSREMVQRWPDLEARHGGGVLSEFTDPGQVIRAILHPRWHEAYVSEVHHILFLSHEEKKRRARAEARGELWRPDEGSDYWSVLFKLPPQPIPIATGSEIAALRVRQKEITAQRRPARRYGERFGAGLSWDPDTVVIDISNPPFNSWDTEAIAGKELA